MLKSLFVWLDAHPATYWVVASVVTLLLARRVWMAIQHPAAPGELCSWRTRAVDALLLFLFVLGWRWPFFFSANDFNPDESQLIAGAITLTRDPVFWRSVDGTTSGPLNFYALLPFHWVGLRLDYFTARLAGLLMVSVALFASHRALTRAFGRAVAWVGVLPAAAFFATVTHPDYVHYSSERVTLMLVGLAIWLLAERSPAERARLWLACGIAGIAPWAKLQAAPLSAALVLWALWQEMSSSETIGARAQRFGGVVLAAATPSVIGALVIVGTGQASTAIHRYFLNNIYYVNLSRTLPEALRYMKQLALLDGRLPLFLGTAIVAIVLAAVLFAVRRARPPGLFIVGGWLTLAAVAAVIAPRREYLHYTLLLPIPLTIWIGAAIGGVIALPRLNRTAPLLLALVALLGVGLPVVTRYQQPTPEMFGQFARHWRYPATAASVIIKKLTTPSDSLGIWGWANHLYVETGLPQATRDPHSTWSILANAQQDYHRAQYLADLQRSRPAVFVDAVGPEAFAYFDRDTQAHEQFPALAGFIRENYSFLIDLGSYRLYARRDLASAARVTLAELQRWIAQGRTLGEIASLPPSITPLDGWQRKFIGGRNVLMLLPPAQLEWQLEGDEREVQLEFGFDPVAWEPGKGNGAEIILELVDASRTRPVFRRLLNPSHVAADRGPMTATVALPPFAPGTRLAIRSTPGENNDNAWDWLYLESLHFRREPHFVPAQFPQFNRVPDFADVGFASLYYANGKGSLSMHAPCMVGYVLDGSERHLRFDYGFDDGAYTNGGNTDGAVIRVERERAGQPAAVLLDRFLQPQLNAGDRGAQHADVDLAGCARGDRLILRVTPGPANNGAWDWTYVDRVELTGP